MILTHPLRLIMAAQLNSISINRLQAICDDYDLPHTPEDTIDQLRVTIRDHLSELSKAITTGPLPTANAEKPKPRSGFRFMCPISKSSKPEPIKPMGLKLIPRK